jgi:hypothetical protein
MGLTVKELQTVVTNVPMLVVKTGRCVIFHTVFIAVFSVRLILRLDLPVVSDIIPVPVETYMGCVVVSAV